MTRTVTHHCPVLPVGYSARKPSSWSQDSLCVRLTYPTTARKWHCVTSLL